MKQIGMGEKMKRKRIIDISCILLIVLLNAAGKRYVFPKAERNIEETVILPKHAHAVPVIKIER